MHKKKNQEINDFSMKKTSYRTDWKHERLWESRGISCIERAKTRKRVDTSVSWFLWGSVFVGYVRSTECTTTRNGPAGEHWWWERERWKESQMYPPNLPTAGQEQMSGDPSLPAIREREWGEALSSSLPLLPSKHPLFACSWSPGTPRPTRFLLASAVRQASLQPN